VETITVLLCLGGKTFNAGHVKDYVEYQLIKTDHLVKILLNVKKSTGEGSGNRMPVRA